MGRRVIRGRLVACLLVAGIAGGCAGGPAASFAPFASAVPGGSGAPGPGEPATPPEATFGPGAVEVTWANAAAQADGTLVAITGRIKAGSMVSCFSHVCDLVLVDPADPSNTVLVDVLAVSDGGVPNTMVELPDPYTEADLRLTADDFSTVSSGDLVRVTGWLRHGDDYLVIEADVLEPVAEPEPTATPAPEVVTFKQLAKLPQGTVVKIKGTLSTPWLTWCSSTSCDIELEDPKSSRWAWLEMPLIRGDAARRNGMLPLPDDFRQKDLKVYDRNGTRIGYGDRVWIIGTLSDERGDDERDIDVTVVIAIP